MRTRFFGSSGPLRRSAESRIQQTKLGVHQRSQFLGVPEKVECLMLHQKLAIVIFEVAPKLITLILHVNGPYVSEIKSLYSNHRHP